MKDDIQTVNIYAKTIGIAGDTLCQSHGALLLVSTTVSYETGIGRHHTNKRKTKRQVEPPRFQ